MSRGSLIVVLVGAAAVLATVPRGVAPEDVRLYISSSESTFTCLTHPSITIPFSQVNDDYCDCPDGSDEPGTSACAILSPKDLSIRGFYCKNAHHTPAHLPLSRVNDGICDYEICCDGSDEYLGVGGVKCPNKCKEIGATARTLAQERYKRRSVGSKAREELIKKSAILRQEIEDNIKTTKHGIEGAEEKVKLLQEQLQETEMRERSKIVKNPTSGSKVNVVAQLAKDRLDEYRNALVTLKKQRDAAKKRLETTEEILTKFREEYNPNFNDEGVKRAVHAWEDYLATSKAENGQAEADIEDLEQLEAEIVDWDAYLGTAEIDDEDIKADLFNLEAYLPAGARDWINTNLANLRQILVGNGMLAPSKKESSSESKEVKAARDALKAAERDQESTRKKLKNLEEDLVKPYGPSDVFRSLKGECVSQDFGEYNYEYCFLDKAYQKSLKDKSKTSLGTFSRIDIKDSTSNNEGQGVFETGWEEAHDEPLSGVVLINDNGQQCWNGPKRSANVELYCSANNEVRLVTEMEKCVYKFEIGTPAVCESAEYGQKDRVRDEL